MNKKSNFVILYHRTPYEEKTNVDSETQWIEHKSPNGIIPTLRNLFIDHEEGTWIAWREVDDVSSSCDEESGSNLESEWYKLSN